MRQIIKRHSCRYVKNEYVQRENMKIKNRDVDEVAFAVCFVYGTEGQSRNQSSRASAEALGCEHAVEPLA